MRRLDDGPGSAERAGSRRRAKTAVGIGLAGAIALGVLGAFRGWAHIDPGNCTATAVSIVLEAYRADRTTRISLTESITDCETVCFRTVVGKPMPRVGLPDPNCAFEDGVIEIVTPDDAVHDVTPASGVPCLGGTNQSEGCDPARFTVTSDFQCYTVRPQDVINGGFSVSTDYSDGTSHASTDDILGMVSASTALSLEVQVCRERDSECLSAVCVPDRGDGVRLGLCVETRTPDSTPCADADGSVCTIPGCEAGVCVQAHQTQQCTLNDCDSGQCDPQRGCVQLPNSTPCPDRDADTCTRAGCEAGVCVQNHLVTPCAAGACTTGACDPQTGVCIHQPVSTPCDADGDFCTVDHCDGVGRCVVLDPNPSPACGHFKCYRTRTGPFQSRPVTLEDQFGRTTATVLRPSSFCNPVDKNGEGIPDPRAHLNCYTIKEPGFQPRTVIMTNQFGEQKLTLLRPEALCVPAIKDEVGDLDDLDVRHLKCYRARRARGASFDTINGVSVVDQFEEESITVLRPHFVCTPVDKNDEDPTAPDEPVHQTCFSITDPAPRFTPRDVQVEDQFVEQDLEPTRRTDCRRSRLLCVPSTKRLMPMP